MFWGVWLYIGFLGYIQGLSSGQMGSVMCRPYMGYIGLDKGYRVTCET